MCCLTAFTILLLCLTLPVAHQLNYIRGHWVILTGIAKAMRHAHMAHNVLKRCIINLLTAQKMRPSHVMALGYFMMSTFTQLPNQVRRRKCMCFEFFLNFRPSNRSL